MRPADAVKAVRKFRGMSQAALAIAVDVSPSTIYKLEAGKEATETLTLVKIASALGMKFDVAAGKFELPADLPKEFIDLTTHTVRGRGLRASTDEKLEITQTLSAMPAMFNLPIAAGGWVELTGEGSSPTAAQLRQGIFVVRIAGDSMSPRWLDKQFVMFQMLNMSEDAPVSGVDYLIVRNDSFATFKRVSKIDGEELTLSALNSKKYPKPLKVSAQEIVMIAEAKVIWVNPPEV